MTVEQYKKYIIEMLDKIDMEKDLSRIYAIVHRKFIKRSLECYERKNQNILYD